MRQFKPYPLLAPMTNTFSFGPRTLSMVASQIVTILVAGAFAWNLTAPQSFFGALGFFFAWGIVSTYSLLLVGSLFMALTGKLRR